MANNYKITDSELIEELNKGKKGKEIADEYDMDHSSVSERISELKKGERKVRDRLSPTGNAGVQVSLEGSLIEQAWAGDSSDELHYQRKIEVDEGRPCLVITLNSMGHGNKLQRPNPDSDSRTATITGRQLKELGFDDNSSVFAQKYSENNAIKLDLAHQRVSEGGEEDMTEDDEDDEDIKIASGDEIKGEEDWETDEEEPEVMTDEEE